MQPAAGRKDQCRAASPLFTSRRIILISQKMKCTSKIAGGGEEISEYPEAAWAASLCSERPNLWLKRLIFGILEGCSLRAIAANFLLAVLEGKGKKNKVQEILRGQWPGGGNTVTQLQQCAVVFSPAPGSAVIPVHHSCLTFCSVGGRNSGIPTLLLSYPLLSFSLTVPLRASPTHSPQRWVPSSNIYELLF